MQRRIHSGCNSAASTGIAVTCSKCLSHGVSLAEIEALFRGDVYTVRDSIVSGERRTLAFGNGAGRWIFCVFTWRGDRIRPVSVRFMQDKEVKRYGKEISRIEE
jgi:uncharacterized DUF497 family protein